MRILIPRQSKCGNKPAAVHHVLPNCGSHSAAVRHVSPNLPALHEGMRKAACLPVAFHSASNRAHAHKVVLLRRYVRICAEDDEALQPEWEIDPKDLQLMEKVGEGCPLWTLRTHSQSSHAAALIVLCVATSAAVTSSRPPQNGKPSEKCSRLSRVPRHQLTSLSVWAGRGG